MWLVKCVHVGYLAKVVRRIASAGCPMIGFHPRVFQHASQLVEARPFLYVASLEGYTVSASSTLATRCSYTGHYFHHITGIYSRNVDSAADISLQEQ